MADTKQAPAAAPAAAETKTETKSARPTMPDEAEYQKKLKVAEKEHKEALDQLSAIKAKIEIAMPNKNKEQQSPTQKRRAELIAQANEIRQKQGAGKNARTSKLDQIKRLDEQMRSRINEQKTARSKVNFKSVEEVDRQIEKLDSEVNSGRMKIVDEKKALAEISSLRKLKKNFSQFDDSQKSIDDLKAKIKEIKDSMEDPEAKAMSEQYNKIQAELDAIKAEGDEAYKNLSSLRDERTRLHNLQNEKYAALKTIKDEYWQQRKAAQAHEREAREKARERRKNEAERYQKERKKADAEKFLADASDPAYLEEIRRANSLLQFLDPTHKVEKAPLQAASGLTAQASRTVDDSGIKGMKVVSKKDRDEDFFPAVKKGKKGKKGGATEDKAGKFNCPPSVVEDCAFMGIDPPMAASDVPAVAEKVKAKLDHWKSDQEAQTQRNIEKAKKQLEKLEADEANGVSNGDSVDEVTKDLKETSVEEKA
ncbi:nuclear segregation protein [Colletotrichum scovillei]|uniref:Nuclear segregation protein n=1 Tax=Colletotrichum scovillei TaxID=1209932 RepID=A0A9P7QRR1_9PEZI|nr:nuclear segregation protein [Colletotrichum scovillei]KAF4773970.1 nuclear segregation protein [Colletotrichum scovillei]KAG7037994.1 nuclear segregation protein [Colletotrichum scovillei]KAG7040335.1 nuclear segregation protein [Colletotrichum scovillei]KAG7060385.1 nuclear segregation protein [Colletotrichum scovillei]